MTMMQPVPQRAACIEKLHGTAKVLTATVALTRPAVRLP
jgi:hypothetical protein